MNGAVSLHAVPRHYSAPIEPGKKIMPTIARRLTILTLMMSIFAISFAALATHNPRNISCSAGGFATHCARIF
jgi:hypothetical protein